MIIYSGIHLCWNLGSLTYFIYWVFLYRFYILIGIYSGFFIAITWVNLDRILNGFLCIFGNRNLSWLLNWYFALTRLDFRKRLIFRQLIINRHFRIKLETHELLLCNSVNNINLATFLNKLLYDRTVYFLFLCLKIYLYLLHFLYQ